MAVVVDSSVWIEWLLTGPGSHRYEPVMAAPEALIVPGIVIFEVMRWTLANVDDEAAQAAAELMTRGLVVPLDAGLSFAAALVARETRLAMADSIILATTRAHGAELWTQDADFAAIPGVRYFAKLS